MDHNKTNILNFIVELRDKIYNITYINSHESFIDSPIKPKNPQTFTLAALEEITASTLSILSKIYGDKHQHVTDFIEKAAAYRKHSSQPFQRILQCCIGKLNAIETDLKFGLLDSIEKEISGEVFSDFLKAAKRSFEEGYKDVAVVLSCAALEDLLKRLGKLNSLDVEDKVMSDVVNALKKEGLIKGAQTNLMSAYVTLRNKTFHAQWDKIDNADVKSLIGFTEELLIKHFS